MSDSHFFSWPLSWPLSLFCDHPSTTGLFIENADGSWSGSYDVECLRCGRALPGGTA